MGWFVRSAGSADKNTAQMQQDQHELGKNQCPQKHDLGCIKEILKGTQNITE